MRIQNDIDYRYHPKSFEEIKTEIQKSRKLGLTKAKRRKLGWTSQREENISGTGITQEAPNPVSTFIIVALVLGALCIPFVQFIVVTLLITALICAFSGR